MNFRLAVLVLAFMTWSHAHGDALSIGIGKDNLAIQYGVDYGSADYGRTLVGGGMLYATDEDKNDHLVLNLDMHILDETGSKSPGLEAGIGPRLYFGTSEYTSQNPNTNEDETENQTFLAFAVGGLLVYRFQEMNRILLNAQAYYAPNITSLLDIEDFWDFGLSIGYEVVPAATIFLGYNLVTATFTVANNETDNREINNNVHLGLSMNF